MQSDRRSYSAQLSQPYQIGRLTTEERSGIRVLDQSLYLRHAVRAMFDRLPILPRVCSVLDVVNRRITKALEVHKERRTSRALNVLHDNLWVCNFDSSRLCKDRSTAGTTCTALFRTFNTDFRSSQRYLVVRVHLLVSQAQIKLFNVSAKTFLKFHRLQ
jgi:hypothetical protein